MKAINLQTEYLINPIGVDFRNPTLTWNVSGAKKQTAYQLKAYINNQLVVDTGKVISSSMKYAFSQELHSRDIVAWNVTLWDENDRQSEISDIASFEMGLLNKTDWSAKWIKGDYKVNKNKRYPVDYFYKEIEVKDVKKARLYISALGIYEAYINGHKVGNGILAPGSTDPRKRVQYDTYDVTSMLKEGKNEILLLLADGWYRGSIGAKGFTYVFGKESKIIAQLEVDGKTFVTDKTWQWSNNGPILFTDLKDGEIVDNRKVISFEKYAKEGNFDGKLTCSNNTHVIEIEHNEPIKVIKTKTSKVTLEYQNNVAGYMSFKVHAHDGDIIHIVMGELLDENDDATLKNVQCIRKGKKTPLQEITFICKEGGQGEAVSSPEGFRRCRRRQLVRLFCL